MDAETMAMVATLRSEIATLRSEMAQMAQNGMAGGEGADVGLPITPVGSEQGTFRWEGDKITHCNFYAAHNVVELADVTIRQGQADGTWYLNVPHQRPTEAQVVRNEEGANDEDNTSIKLFTIENGEVKKDYRGMPFIPIYA